MSTLISMNTKRASSASLFLEDEYFFDLCDELNQELLPQFQSVEVLLIDDDVEHLSLFETILKGNNYNVITATSVEEAFTKIQFFPISIIICDVKMPSKDGFDFLYQLRSNSELSYLPTIMLTGTDTDHILEKALLSTGADLFCSKKTPNLLLSQIEFLLK